MRNRRFALSRVAVLGLTIFMIMFVSFVGASIVNADETETESADTVTVSGSYTIYTAPDKAELYVAVTTKDSKAAGAQTKNTKDVDAVIQKLKELGGNEKSIITSGYNIYQEYDYEKNEPAGYTVSTSLTIKDIEIDMAGTILSEAVAAGVNEVYYISYSCSSYDEKYEEALTDAVLAARKKAEVLAKAADRILGDVQSITEGYQNTSARYVNKSIAIEEAAMDTAAGSVSLNPGDSEITASVTVTYYLK